MIQHESVLRSPLPVPAARAAVLLWCQTIGYRLTSPPFLSSVELERGSWAGNFGSLNPRTWRSKIRVSFRPSEPGCEIQIDWTVTTTGQVGTKADIVFWTYEVARTQEAAVGRQPDGRALLQQASKAQGGNTWRALLFSFSLLGPLIGFSFISGWLGLGSAAVLGSATWLVFRAPRTLGDIPPPAALPPVMLTPPPIADPNATSE